MTRRNLEISLEVVERMKKGIVDYILEHCSAALGVSADRLSSKNIRDYCYTGFTEDEFVSVRIESRA